MVFLHARFTPPVGAPAYALADIFRVKDYKIIEHWDVVAAPRKNSAIPTAGFDRSSAEGRKGLFGAA
jgi:predicted SnoaL-like aldol condensation-catalyzing enzyme